MEGKNGEKSFFQMTVVIFGVIQGQWSNQL